MRGCCEAVWVQGVLGFAAGPRAARFPGTSSTEAPSRAWAFRPLRRLPWAEAHKDAGRPGSASQVCPPVLGCPSSSCGRRRSSASLVTGGSLRCHAGRRGRLEHRQPPAGPATVSSVILCWLSGRGLNHGLGPWPRQRDRRLTAVPWPFRSRVRTTALCAPARCTRRTRTPRTRSCTRATST